MNRRDLLRLVGLAPVAAAAAAVGIEATPPAVMSEESLRLAYANTLSRYGLILTETTARHWGIAKLEREISAFPIDPYLDRVDAIMHGVHPHDEYGRCVLTLLGTP
jgi:hypothetical protein